MPNTREKLIELLETVVSPKDVLCDGEVLVSTSRVADHLISHGVTVQQWIPVTERLPEENTEVLTYRESGMYTEMRFGREWEVDVFSDCPVTHWMPLPQPPKGE